MNPVKPPKRIGGKDRRVINDRPIFMNYRKETVHLVGHILEVWRPVISHINRFFAITAPKLRNVRNRSIIEGPKCVFVECLNPFFQSNFDAIGQQVILAKEVLFLDSSKKSG